MTRFLKIGVMVFTLVFIIAPSFHMVSTVYQWHIEKVTTPMPPTDLVGFGTPPDCGELSGEDWNDCMGVGFR